MQFEFILSKPEFELLKKKLDALPINISKKILRKACARAGVIVRKEARAKAPFKSGRLRRSVKSYSVPLRRSKYTQINDVYVDKGKSREDPKGAWYGFIVEKKKPYMRPTFDKGMDLVMPEFEGSLRSQLAKVATNG